MATSDRNARFARIEALFNEALAHPAGVRDSWLQEQCGDDASLLESTRSLLRAFHLEHDLTETLLNTSTDSTVKNKRLGPYEILSLLGRGGMGAVYLAQRADGQYEKKVAIKLIDLPLATEVFYERFRQERQILAGLDHPDIARMLDGGISEDGILYLVMEYVEGKPIDEYCLTHKPSTHDKLRLFVRVCKAVQFAHQNLVVHRDLKPDNILVSADGAPHLLDFGTAKLLSADRTADTQGLTRQGFLSFTPAYASPEQVLGKPITTATDTYSLGVLLYLLLTERLPYQLNEYTTEEMVNVICEKAPEPPTSDDGTFPDADLSAILSKALRKEPEERYQTAEQLAADVEAYLDQKPVLARKGTLRYTASKFVRRNRLAISFAGVLLLTLIAGVAGVLYQSHAAKRSEQRAEARSTDLLQLSDSLLSELDSAIQELPGSTGTQQLLVARVLQSLERMNADARNDKATGLSLANAYMRLANLQGDPYEQNIGDTKGAILSINKALTILTSFAKKYPEDVEVFTTLAHAQNAKGEILSLADDNPGAAASLTDSINTYERLLALPNPTPKLCFQTATVYDTLGDVMGQDTGFSDWEAAMSNYRKAIDLDMRALSIDPNYAIVRRGLVVMEMKVGNVYLDIDPEQALTEFAKSMRRLDALTPAERALLTNVRVRGLLLRKEAVALSELGRFSEAQPLFEKSTAIYESIVKADPKDKRALQDMVRLLSNELDSDEHAADPLLSEPGFDRNTALRQAQDVAEQKLKVVKQLLEAQDKDADLKIELATTEVHLAAVQEKLHSDTGNREHTKEALFSLRSAAEDPKASPRTLELAFDTFAIAEPASFQDPAFLLECAQRGASLTKRKTVDWMLALAYAYRIRGDVAKEQEAATEGLALLPAPTPGGKNFRVRKLLEMDRNQLSAHIQPN